METKYKLGDDVKGTCPNCFGRGRKQHLEYNGDNEVVCMVCSSIIKLNNYAIDLDKEKYLNFKKLKGGIENGSKK